jgi:hypothetical protein
MQDLQPGTPRGGSMPPSILLLPAAQREQLCVKYATLLHVAVGIDRLLKDLEARLLRPEDHRCSPQTVVATRRFHSSCCGLLSSAAHDRRSAFAACRRT